MSEYEVTRLAGDYRVIREFYDLVAGKRRKVGEYYHSDDKERVNSLLTNANRRRIPLIVKKEDAEESSVTGKKSKKATKD